MNLLDFYVTEVIGSPYYVDKYLRSTGRSWWELKVKADAYGRESGMTLNFRTKEEADEIKIGYVFQA